jgi:hypothetical protein
MGAAGDPDRLSGGAAAGRVPGAGAQRDWVAERRMLMEFLIKVIQGREK